jgi:hypothetical protein
VAAQPAGCAWFGWSRLRILRDKTVEEAIMSRLVGVALLFLFLGSTLGYEIGTGSLPRLPRPGSAPARYMAGLQQMDGEALWVSMSPSLQAQAIREGDTEATFADFYRQLRTRGNRIDEVQYVGGYQAKDKGMFVYVTRRVDAGKEPIEIIWILVTDPEGLVDYVI